MASRKNHYTRVLARHETALEALKKKQEYFQRLARAWHPMQPYSLYPELRHQIAKMEGQINLLKMSSKPNRLSLHQLVKRERKKEAQ